MAGYAERDFAGVVAADAFVLLAEPVEGQAKYVELGIALHANTVAGRPLVYVVGRDTNESIFFFHPAVRRRRSIGAVLAEIDPAPDVRVVSLPPERWSEYKRLRLEALAQDPAAFSSTLAETTTFPDEHWRQRLANPGALHRFAERDGRLVGMAGAYLAAEDEPGVAVVFGVYVGAAERGRGIGRLLVSALLGELRGRGEIRIVRLWVNPKQAPALALYRALGFAVVGREEEEGREGTEATFELIMERPTGLSCTRSDHGMPTPSPSPAAAGEGAGG